jgi:hypothetical protein
VGIDGNDSLDAILPELVPEEDGPVADHRRLLTIVGVIGLVVFAFVAGGMVLGGSGSSDNDRRPAAAPETTTTTTTPTVAPPTTPTTATGTTPPTTALATEQHDLAGAEAVVHRLIAAVERRDCNAIVALLSTGTMAFMNSIAENGETGKEQLCEGLHREPIPKISVSKAARPGPNGTVIVELLSGDDVDDMILVREGAEWKIDLIGHSVHDSDRGSDEPPAEAATSTVERDLRNAMVAQEWTYSDHSRYTDDVGRLREVEPALDWRRGIADGQSPIGAVYVALADNGKTVCVSAVASAGRERYMVKATAGDHSYARGAATPTTCDSRRLGDRW